MSFSDIRNVAVVGAGGRVGAHIVRGLQEKNFTITVIARSESKYTPNSDGIKVHKGDYSDDKFLQEALADQDALVLVVASEAVASQKPLIAAAVKAGVKRIIPSEFGSDGENSDLVAAVPFYTGKVDILKYLRDQTSQSNGKTTWTGIATGPFLDMSLAYGMWGIDVKERKAKLYDEGKAKFDTTALPTVGKAVAAVLAKGTSAYKNEYIYVNTACTNQRELLSAVQTATRTTEKDWTIAPASATEFFNEGAKKLAAGDFMGAINMIYGATFQGLGSAYSEKKPLANKDLGLEKENLDDAVKQIVQAL